MKKTITILFILALCALVAPDVFGCQQDLKRKRSDQGQGQKKQKQENVFTFYPQLPNELQRHVIGMADLYSIENLTQTSHQTCSDVKNVSQCYIHSAQEHAEEVSVFKNKLHEMNAGSRMDRRAFRDAGERLSTVNFHIEMAQLDHDCREYGIAVSHSRAALAIPMPQMPDDKMMIDGV